MHLTALNITDLIMGLFRGTLEVGPGDDIDTWDWAVLTGDTWKEHGAIVASFKRHLSSSIDRPPRDPSKKINSGYKAVEFLNYVYGMLPALLYGVLPEPYYGNFCKLVYGVRIICQRVITADELREAHRAFTEFVVDFEEIYVQRDASRIHFVRQCIHNLIHLCPETIRVGPLSLLAQWLMERTIGNLGEEIKQPSNPYKNLSERGLQRAQTNAAISMLNLDPPPAPPKGSVELGDGYFLLNPTARSPMKMTDAEKKAFLLYARGKEPGYLVGDKGIRVIRKGRIRLPTQQIGRTAWKEHQKSSDAPLRISRMVKDEEGNSQKDIFFGEVSYFFEAILNGESEGLAMVSLCDNPNSEILGRSRTTLWVTRLIPGQHVRCIPISVINSVVSLLPFPHIPGTLFLFEKSGP
ncbi:hypothetical protein FA13DRAFT_1644510 [Coprinellus micaceus]|uniref:Uncharacterized protein n=1 Tax=Coprinellus micaceus TaxID=71717 RepID=A0A4Y7SFS6_COPMI|nr:hypothetical protein FA13DRAFT_1644510 [Coprinellus micaceus]